MNDLKNELIKLGSENPQLQKHIRPVLDRISMDLKKKFEVAYDILQQYGDDPQSSNEDGYAGHTFYPDFGNQTPDEFEQDLKSRLKSELRLSDVYVVRNVGVAGGWFVGITSADRAEGLKF
jgi:hypothetical protein